MPPPAQTSYREGPVQVASPPRPVVPPPSDPPTSKYSTDSRKIARVHASGLTRTVQV